MNNQAELDRSFDALSHPARRAIVERLVAGPATVGKASAGLGISKPAVTKHLKVLEVNGVVSRTVRGRTRPLNLEPRPLREASSWLDLHRPDVATAGSEETLVIVDFLEDGAGTLVKL